MVDGMWTIPTRSLSQFYPKRSNSVLPKSLSLLNVAILPGLMLSGCVVPGTNPPPSATSKAVKPVSPPPSIAVSPTPAPVKPVVPSSADVTRANTYRQQALQYRDQGRHPQAIAALQKSIQLDPRNLSSYVILGWTQHLAGQPPAAIQTLRQALQRNPNHVPALNALGIVYLTSGQLQAAVTTHTQALKLKPDNEIAYYNLSLAYHRLQQYALSVSNALAATRLEPDNPHPWVALAIAYWDQGKKAEAQRAYQQALSLDAGYGDRGFLAHLKDAGFSVDQIKVVERILSSGFN